MAYRVVKETSCCDCCKNELPLKIIKSTNRHLLGMIPLIQSAVFYTLPSLKLPFRAPNYYNGLRDSLGKREYRVYEWYQFYRESITTGTREKIDYTDL